MERLETSVNWGEKGWDSFFVQKGKRWRDKDYRYINDIFDLHILKGSLLDVGCGMGDGLVYLKNKCSKIDRFIGTDFSCKAIEVCRNNTELSTMEFFQHNIIESLPEKYDNIICLQTLEHVEDPPTAMQNLIDAAQNLLIVGVPYRNKRPDENHLWSFDENDFSDLADFFCLDRKRKNIYWLIDKQKKGARFYKKRLHFLHNLIEKLNS